MPITTAADRPPLPEVHKNIVLQYNNAPYEYHKAYAPPDYQPSRAPLQLFEQKEMKFETTTTSPTTSKPYVPISLKPILSITYSPEPYHAKEHTASVAQGIPYATKKQSEVQTIDYEHSYKPKMNYPTKEYHETVTVPDSYPRQETHMEYKPVYKEITTTVSTYQPTQAHSLSVFTDKDIIPTVTTETTTQAKPYYLPYFQPIPMTIYKFEPFKFQPYTEQVQQGIPYAKKEVQKIADIPYEHKFSTYAIVYTMPSVPISTTITTTTVTTAYRTTETTTTTTTTTTSTTSTVILTPATSTPAHKNRANNPSYIPYPSIPYLIPPPYFKTP